MDIDSRKDKILELLASKGKVRVTELSELFGVSEVTVRMDLADLEARGLLSRVHGGAMSSYKTYHNMSLQQRLGANHEKKAAIASRAAEMVEDHDTVMFNSGTTTLLTFRMLNPNLNLSIVTNSIAIALEAGANPNFNVVLLGGDVNAKYQFTCGSDAAEQIKRYHADKLVLSVDGVDTENGFSTYYDKEVALDRLMLENSSMHIIAADYTKIGRTTFAKISDIDVADYIITNKNASEEDKLILREFAKIIEV